MNTKIDDFINKSKTWQQEYDGLRSLILDCNLIEELKWNVPCYSFNKQNIVLFHGFKSYCAITFFKGALLQDIESILIQPTEKTQAARQIRFTTISEIRSLEKVIKRYIFEAIEVEKAGLTVEFKKNSEIEIPEELIFAMSENHELKTAFYALTPGRQKGYLYFFSEAKQSKTRTSRIENSVSRIMKGKGLMDCVCGLSKKMPSCDGSHKFLKNL